MRNRAVLLSALFLALSGCAKDRATSSAVESIPEKETDFTAAKTAASAAPPTVGGARARGDGIAALDDMDDKGGLAAPRAMATSATAGGYAASPIRAGEWDDNANYREYQRYLGAVSQPILKWTCARADF